MMLSDACCNNLLALAAAFAKAEGLSLAQVSARFYGNRQFFKELKKRDRSVSVDIADKIFVLFAQQWPAGTRWPKLDAHVVDRAELLVHGKRRGARRS